VIEPYVGRVSFSDPVLTVRGAAYSLAGAKPVATADDLRGARLAAAASGVGRSGASTTDCLAKRPSR
jgi:hypothetical protein